MTLLLLSKVIGTSGTVKPASNLPYEASYNGAQIVEVRTTHMNVKSFVQINVEPTTMTNKVSDFFFQARYDTTIGMAILRFTQKFQVDGSC